MMCEFCHEFNLVASLNKSNAERGFDVNYYSCFVEDRFYDETYSGRTCYHTHPLNYCPECGKRLNMGTPIEVKL